MFEQGLSFLLKKLLRDFVEDGDNLNEKVQVGVWSGLIVLENLVLKNSIFNLLDIPIVLNYGYIGRFELHIPWSRLGYEPVTVVLDKIYILVEPKYEWNPGAADRREQAMKQAKLTAAELFASQRLQESQNNGGYAGLAKNWFLGALISKIVDKIQITIRELHFRYEDKMSCPTEFCVGLSFESLHLLSREGSGRYDEHFSPSKSHIDTERNYDQELKITGSDAWHKLIELNHLALYWNPLHSKGLDVCSCAFIGRSPREIQTLMSRTVVTRVFKSYERPRHHYILNPVDINAFLDVSVNLATANAKVSF
jgi:vacuolar protein sorting-associated protein 13A/C